MKKTIVSVALAIIALAAIHSNVNVSGTEAKHGTYPNSGIVTDIYPEADMVIVATSTGSRWSFRGVEDWMVGDNAAMIMDDNGTPDYVFDDEIVSVRYCG